MHLPFWLALGIQNMLLICLEKLIAADSILAGRRGVVVRSSWLVRSGDDWSDPIFDLGFLWKHSCFRLDELVDLCSPASLRYQALFLLAQNGQKWNWHPLLSARVVNRSCWLTVTLLLIQPLQTHQRLTMMKVHQPTVPASAKQFALTEKIVWPFQLDDLQTRSKSSAMPGTTGVAASRHEPQLPNYPSHNMPQLFQLRLK